MTTTTTTLSYLPRDLLDHTNDFLTGFDLLALSCASKSLHVEMERDQTVWRKRLSSRAREADKTWKEQYAAARSLRLSGASRSSAIPLPSDLAPKWQNKAFSVDMWFCLAPPSSKDPTAYTGGVLLGAQSTLCTDDENTRPEFHQQLIHVDVNGNLYCSITANKPIVKAKLQFERWYHVALTYTTKLQCVFLDGQLLKVAQEPIHVEWGKMKGLQFGSGFMTFGSKGRPNDKYVGWYGLNGVLDDHRVWGRALSMGEIQSLARGEQLPSSSPRPTWSADQEEMTTSADVKLVRCTRPSELHYVSAGADE